MTLIASIKDHRSLILVSDALITNKLRQGGIIKDLPQFSGLEIPSGIHVVGLAQKTVAINNNTVFAWAGKASIAINAVETLKSVAPEKLHCKSYIISTIDQFVKQGDLSCLYYNSHLGNVLECTYDCSVIDMPGFGTLRTAGSGESSLVSMIAPDEFGSFGYKELKDDRQNLLAKAQFLDNKLAFLPARNTSQLAESWGGAYETTVCLPDQTFSKVWTTLHVNSALDMTNKENPTFHFGYYYSYKWYVGELLIVYDLEPSVGRSRVVYVPPVGVNIDGIKVPDNLLAQALQLFHIVSHGIHIHDRDDRSGLISWTQSPDHPVSKALRRAIELGGTSQEAQAAGKIVAEAVKRFGIEKYLERKGRVV